MATKVFTAAEIDFSSAAGPPTNWATVAAAWVASMNGDSGVVTNDLVSAGGDQVLAIIGIPHDDSSLPAVITMSNVNIEFDWAITNTTVAAGNVSWIESDSNGANKQFQTSGVHTGHSSGDYDPVTYFGGTDRAALFSAGVVWTYWWEDEATGRVSGRVVVTNYTVTVTYTAPSTAAVTSVRPASGPVIGAQAVTVRGLGFNIATGVTIGGVAATSMVIVSDTTITCVTPAHRSGVVDVVVAGVGTGTQLYTYAVTSGVRLPPVPIRSAVASSGLPASPRGNGSPRETMNETPPMDLAYQQWLMNAKQVLEDMPTRLIGTEQVIGTFDVDQIPELPWTKILKAGSSLGDLETRSATDINAGVLAVRFGGTGLVTYAVGDLIYASAALTLASLADVSAGSYLRSGGVATAPLWSTLKLPNAATSGDILKASGANVYASAAPAALTRVNDTNVTLTLGGSDATALVNAASLTLGWTGTLSAARGGSGLGSYAVGDLLTADTTTTLTRLADVATGSVLVSGGVSAAPAWSASPTIATKLTVGSALALGTTSTDGVSVINSTPATNGVPIQISPRVRLAGTAYNSVSALSETDAFYFEVVPSNAAGATRADLVFLSSLNGAAGVERLRIASAGSVASDLNVAGEAFWRLGNSHTGTASFADLAMVNAVSNFNLYKLGSGFTTSGQYIQNSTLLEDNGAAGMSFSATSGILSFYTNNALRAKFENAGAFNLLTSLSLNSKLAVSATAPTFTSGFGGATGRTISGTAFSFTITVGSLSTGATGVLAMPTATTGWTIHAVNLTAAGTPSPYAILQTAKTTTSVSVVQIDMSDAGGRTVDFAAGDILQCIAVAY